ncbi:MAG: hypothetical protein JKY52_18540 [Flavobacteriales bacterium]|nr:hypothetical protein [Flavobacteriales bacterium]
MECVERSTVEKQGALITTKISYLNTILIGLQRCERIEPKRLVNNGWTACDLRANLCELCTSAKASGRRAPLLKLWRNRPKAMADGGNDTRCG